MDKIDFSVLIPVYHKEVQDYFDAALTSIERQTRTPSEIVVVKDGPLTPELERVIDIHRRSGTVPYRIVALEKNRGLGTALQKGLEACRYEWVARMDSDDIALPERFEKQFAYLAEHPDIDILGSWICEFDEDPNDCTTIRRVPSDHAAIVRFARYRCPLNHMTVVYRKATITEVGGYHPMASFEDYYLWMRLLVAGKRFANIPEVLVKARTGNGMLKRRRGWRYMLHEIALEKAAFALGFWHTGDLVRNLFVRVLPRLLPASLMQKVYNLLRRW